MKAHITSIALTTLLAGSLTANARPQQQRQSPPHRRDALEQHQVRPACGRHQPQKIRKGRRENQRPPMQQIQRQQPQQRRHPQQFKGRSQQPLQQRRQMQQQPRQRKRPQLQGQNQQQFRNPARQPLTQLSPRQRQHIKHMRQVRQMRQQQPRQRKRPQPQGQNPKQIKGREQQPAPRLSAQQRRKIQAAHKQLLQRYDRDGDGRLSPQERKAVKRALMQGGKDPQRPEKNPARQKQPNQQQQNRKHTAAK